MQTTLGNFTFPSTSQKPIELPHILVQFIRYQKGNLITVNYNDIQEIIPYPKRKSGGNIIFKNGAKDIYYNVWSLTLVNK